MNVSAMSAASCATWTRTGPTRKGRTGASRPGCARWRAGSARSPRATERSTRSGGSAYLRLDPRTSHDLSFPFSLVKRGWRCVYEPHARAVERPLPTVESEFRRKRRMMSHAWPAVFRGGMLDPRGYGFLYGLEIFSHRRAALRDAVAAPVALRSERRPGRTGRGVRRDARLPACGPGRGLGGPVDRRPRAPAVALCYYYVLVTASLAAGSLGLASQRHAGDLGAGGGKELSGLVQAAQEIARSRGGAGRSLVVSSPRAGGGLHRDPARELAARRSTGSAGSERTACPSTSTSCARW